MHEMHTVHRCMAAWQRGPIGHDDLRFGESLTPQTDGCTRTEYSTGPEEDGWMYGVTVRIYERMEVRDVRMYG